MEENSRYVWSLLEIGQVKSEASKAGLLFLPKNPLTLSLPSTQIQLLDDHVKELQRVLKPGAKRLNWNSLGISDFITKCEQVR